MDATLFEKYTELNAVGRKSEAKAAMVQFVASFASLGEKQAWSRDHLQSLEINGGGRVRHELYEGVIFPALLEGYRRNDAWSLFWLAKTIQNLFSAQQLHKLVDRKSDLDLLMQAFALDEGSTEIRDALLRRLVSEFEYCEHEWPSGILYGLDGATPVECDLLMDELSLARKLDTEGRFAGFLWRFERRLELYRARLPG